MGFKVHPLAETATSGSSFVNPISAHDAALRTGGHASSSGQFEGAGSPSGVGKSIDSLLTEAARPSGTLHHDAYASGFTSNLLLIRNCTIALLSRLVN